MPVSQGDRQQNLSAFMTAKSDPDNYGKLQAFVLPRGGQIDGPALINSRIQSTAEIAQELTLLNREGSRVQQGNVLVIPIRNSLLYIRPIYVEATRNPVPELRKVVVVYGRRAVMGNSLQEALTKLFGSAPPTLETPTAPAPGDQPAAAPDVNALLDQAAAAFREAEEALRNGDLAGYQAKVRQAQSLVDQAAAASEGQSTTTTTRPPPASA